MFLFRNFPPNPQVWPFAQRSDSMSFIPELSALPSSARAKAACGAPIASDDAFNLANVYVTLGWKRMGKESRHITLNRSVGNTLATH